MKRSFYSYKKQTIAAGAWSHVDVMGEFVFFTSATGPFQIKFDDDGEGIVCDVGFEFHREPGDYFRRIHLHNPGGAPITVEMYAGVGRVNRIGQINNPTFNLSPADIAAINPVSQQHACGLTVASGPGNVAAGKRMVSLYAQAGPVIVLGQTLQTGMAVEFVARGRFDTVGAVSYDATGGSLLIATLG